MSDLRQMRDYATDDGERYWYVGPFHALQAVVGEMERWPWVRLIVPDTGEILEGPLRSILTPLAAALERGNQVRLEPLLAGGEQP